MSEQRENNKLVVLGGGESGTGAALLAQHKGYEVFLSDSGKLRPNYRQKLELAGVPFEEGGHDMNKLLAAALVVKSPGIPDTAPSVQALDKADIPVISEIEFAWRYTDAPVIAITGSNGKTTTTSLTWQLLHNAGFNATMAGNVGSSFAMAVMEDEAEVWVLELSSFQLDGIVDFRPDVAMILNITPDHLDRYNYSMEEYAASKMRIAMNQTEEDCLIYCMDDEFLVEQIKTHNPLSQRIPFTAEYLPALIGQTDDTLLNAAWVSGDQMIVNLKKKDFRCLYTI